VLEHVLGLSHSQLLATPNPLLSSAQKQKLTDITERLLRHEPIQYVLGEAYFYGYRFRVNSSTLIPRPETEELVNRIVSRHRYWPSLSIADICTGSGCIGLSLAKELPQSRVTLTDISQEALEVARVNAVELAVNTDLRRHDVLKEPLEGKFEVVVSNPPYVRPSEKALMQANVLDWEPHLALFIPEENPLLFYRSIGEKARIALNPNGWLYFEINEAYGSEVANLMKELGFVHIQVLKDMQGRDRMVEGCLVR
jgi:release factor glutamine methyltransferase